MKMRFIKLPKHKRFDYQPRYYDEKKERMEERKRKISQQQDNKKRTRDDIEISFRRSSGVDNKYRSKQLMSANIRLVIILAALTGLCYYFFIYMDKLTPLIEKFTK